jgi:hypothetical protein
MKIIMLFLALALPFQTGYRVPPGTVAGWGIMSGNELFEECRTKDSVACLEYISGVVDEIGYLEGATLAPDRHEAWPFSFICMPSGATTLQTRDVVVKYLGDHPEYRTRSAPSLVMKAMLNVWQCPDK